MNERLSKYEDHVILGPVVRYLKANMGILAAFLVLCAVLSVVADNFATVNNWLTIMRTVSTTGFLAIGVMLAIMLGGIDLVGGAMIACSGCLYGCLYGALGASHGGGDRPGSAGGDRGRIF